MILDEQTRKEIQDENKSKALWLDTKQHCLKILQGIEKFDENTAHRAIWELVQNARDLACAELNCVHIRIEMSENELLFAHNGKSFNYDSLSSLVKQVSSLGKDEADTIGQFGTGFMSTHKFSRILYINGSYEVKPGVYVALNRFKIDRSANEVSLLCKAMMKQLEEVENLLKQETTTDKAEWTEFIYDTDTAERKKVAQQGVEAAMAIMPYVMVINERIVECSITDKKGYKILFKKEKMPDEDGLHVMRIWKNEEPIDCYYLQSADKKDIIFIPLRSSTEAIKINKVPRMFIFFPLLGTEENGINYIYHSERFFPTEPRDLIVLPNGNIEISIKAETNARVLSEMSNMLFAYLAKHVDKITNSINLAPIGFGMAHEMGKIGEFLVSRHKHWVRVFKQLPLLEVGKEHVSIESGMVRVLDHTIVDFIRQKGNDKYLDIVYEYACKVSPLPCKKDVLEWSEIIFQWDSEESKWFITIDDIVDEITSVGDKEGLKTLLSFLKDCGKSIYFRKKSIIPNREGKLCTFNELRNGKEFPSNLYDVCKPLVPSFTSQMIDDEFLFLDDFVLINREDLKTSLSTYVSEQDFGNIDNCTLNNVLRFCLTFPTENPCNNDRYKAMKVICSHYTDVPFEVNYVPHLGDVTREQNMYKIIFDLLVKYELKRIENEAIRDDSWYKNEINAKYLFELLISLSDEKRQSIYQNDIMPRFAIFPNQNGRLCKAEDLYVLANDEVHPFQDSDVKELCSYFLDVTGIDKRESWVDERFVAIQSYKKENAKIIADNINDKLNEKKYTQTITIEIIDHIDKDEEVWKYWFPYILENKAHIFLSRIKAVDRENVYTLMKTDEKKLAALACLATNGQMERIIEEGTKVINQEKDKREHNEFIARLGKYVEQILFEKIKGLITEDSLHVEICDQQGGQDFTIKLNEEVVYYVEVKSRWTTSEVVEMSPLQFRTSVEKKDCYALCFVDMTWKRIENVGEREYGDMQTCISKTKVLLDIGERNQWCFDSVQSTKDKPHIGGSYSLTIPQELFRSEGVSTFDGLVAKIREVIENKVNHTIK